MSRPFLPLGWPAAEGDLPRTPDRDRVSRLLRTLIPAVSGEPSPIHGGRRAADRLLAAIDPERYGAERNHLDGPVTRLSPYLRHGVVTMAEVREAVIGRLLERGITDPGEIRRRGGGLLRQLAWRDYWQRLWRHWGDGIWRDREPLRTGHDPATYAPRLPADLVEARTGLACMDAFSRDLQRTGWLHNHARLWLAAYVVHERRVRWQSGAAWFLRHLLDGDPASNNLSWQWVAGSFSSRPYLFSRSGLEHCSDGRHCRRCPAAAGRRSEPGGCPFDADRDALAAEWFRPGAAAAPAAPPVLPAPSTATALGKGVPRLHRPILWIHAEALGPRNPALRASAGTPALFVFDTELIAGRTATSSDPGAADGGGPLDLKRLVFLHECLQELPVTIRCGDVAAEVLRFAARHGADGVVTSRGVDPRFELLRARIAARLPVRVLEPEPFLVLPLERSATGGRPLDLRRFSRYWRRAEPALDEALRISLQQRAGPGLTDPG